MNPTNSEIKEMKKTWKGKFKLWQLGKEKFKADPPVYRIHMMQGLSTKLTIYMILFASIYAVSIGFWVFALIILPVGTIGNYYAMKSHFIKYKNSVKQYELAGMIPSIKDDVSGLRRRWRTIENKIGFLGIDLIFILFLVVLTIAYFSDMTTSNKIFSVLGSLIPLSMFYFGVIYDLCRGEEK